MLCPKCGSENTPSNTYCCNCGEKLKNNTQLTKDNFPTKNKSSNSSNNNFIGNLFNDTKKFSLILTVMVCIIIINICVFVHKRNKVSTKNTINNKIENKKSIIPKEQINAEKKIIDDYVNKVNDPSYTDYIHDSTYLDSKLSYNNYFKSSYKKDAFLLRAHGFAYTCLKSFIPEDKDPKKWPRTGIYIFIDYISYIDPEDTLGYHIDTKKFFSVIKTCGEKIFNIDLKKWKTIYNDKNTLSPDEWNKKYGDPSELNKSSSLNESFKYTEPKKPEIGMTKDQVLKSTWGQPKDINKTITAYGTSEQWVYSISKYIYFEDGIVTAIQN